MNQHPHLTSAYGLYVSGSVQDRDGYNTYDWDEHALLHLRDDGSAWAAEADGDGGFSDPTQSPLTIPRGWIKSMRVSLAGTWRVEGDTLILDLERIGLPRDRSIPDDDFHYFPEAITQRFEEGESRFLILDGQIKPTQYGGQALRACTIVED